MLFKEDTVAKTQHDAIRNNVGWYRWTHDLLEVTGTDAADFLDLIYVNSIGKTPIGRSKYTTMLDEDGKIIDDVIVMHIDENCFWVSTLYIDELITWIESKKSDMDISYKDITNEMEMVAIQGPNSKKLINKLVNETIDDLKYFASKDNQIGNIKVKIHRSGFTGEVGYEIYCDSKDVLEIEKKIEEAGIEFNVVKITVLEVMVRSIPGEKGFVLRQDVLGLNPFETDMGWAVDMNKNFIGKEATIKLKENGPKNQLVGIEFDAYNDINQGELIKIDGITVGYVTAIMYGYTIDRNIGYAVVEKDKVSLETYVKVGRNNVPGKLVNRIWYDIENTRARS